MENRTRQRSNYTPQVESDHQRLVNQVDEMAERQGQTAVILERLTNYFQDHDRRISALEDQPAASRANSLSDRTQAIMLGSLLISLLALLVSVLHGGPITIP